MNIEDLEILECELLEEKENIQTNKTPHPTPLLLQQAEQAEKQTTNFICLKGAREQFKYNPAVKPLFKTSRERYEYLMKYGCTCNNDRNWLANYKGSKEYSGLPAEG